MTFDLEAFLERVRDWARQQPQIAGIGLVGSYARGNPTLSSDLDLVIRVEHPEAFVHDRAWASTFGDVLRSDAEDWGRVRAVRVWYADGLEVEYGFADLEWGADPQDAGTQAVIRAGYRSVYERDQPAPGEAGEHAR
jgi:predicted nucleotidyltransferase